jgi:hypothetical protein
MQRNMVQKKNGYVIENKTRFFDLLDYRECKATIKNSSPHPKRFNLEQLLINSIAPSSLDP